MAQMTTNLSSDCCYIILRFEGTLMSLQQWLSLPVAELLTRARLGVRLFPDVPAMMEHFARSMADEISSNNARNEPKRAGFCLSVR